MRVIAGKHGSRPLAEFKGREVRPTSDRAKEALFNILQTRIYGSDFLDLFSGTGSIGIEAISRGAGKVTFVDNSAESVAIINKNLAYLKETGEVVRTDAMSFVASCSAKYDIIFLDPPYRDDVTEIIEKAAYRRLLKENGILIYEHSGESAGEKDGLELFDTRRYGIATFDFYRSV